LAESRAAACGDEAKFVIQDRADFDACDVVRRSI
jgi:hypothetical protein